MSFDDLMAAADVHIFGGLGMSGWTYTPPGGGAAVPFTPIPLIGDAVVQGGGGEGAVAAVAVLQVRVAELAIVREGGTVSDGTDSFSVVAPHRPEHDRSVWIFSLGAP